MPTDAASAELKPEILDALRKIETFADLPERDFRWFASKCNLVHLQPGDCYVAEGAPANSLFVILEGEIRAKREHGPGQDLPAYSAGKGAITGLLPFSRMKNYPRTGRAATHSLIAEFPKEHFPELFRRAPALLERLVHVMLDRARDITIAEQQHEKLVALGKLSAGLAHELNNPAGAARRAHEEMRHALRRLLNANVRLDERPLEMNQRRYLACAERETVQALGSRPDLSPLERSDREAEISAWLEKHGVEEPWTMAPTFVEMTWTIADLDDLASRFDEEDLPCVLSRLTATAGIGELLNQTNRALTRISSLVDTMKNYSNMDRVPEEEMDLHQGLESTLAVMAARLTDGVAVQRDYDYNTPHITGNLAALNQVWTNLIDNSLDAMEATGGVLTVRTRPQHDGATVEVIDNGPGIPSQIHNRVFEPFFTTKPPDRGVGLGLDTVYRIVRQHHGQVTFTSVPGNTCFCVRLPYRRLYSV